MGARTTINVKCGHVPIIHFFYGTGGVCKLDLLLQAVCYAVVDKFTKLLLDI